MIERVAGVGELVVQRWVGGSVDVLLDVVPHRVEVGLRLRLGVVLAEEEVGIV